MRISIDVEACVGHGRCYAIAPDVFDADDQGHALLRSVVADRDVPSEHRDAARTGANNCPEGAILIVE